ncbi:MAG: universal stress protein [Chloroflexi bacterium]|nr:universal stress protein [Chloroflexota bacterium]
MFQHRPFNKIVVPTDGSAWSERAIPYAVDFARISEGEVILLHIFTPPMHEFVDSLAIAGEYELANRIREEIKQHLLALRNEVRAEGVGCRLHIIDAVGVAQHIIEYVEGEEADLVVMTTHGHSGLARLVFGSVANKVMHDINAPVLVIRPDLE